MRYVETLVVGAGHAGLAVSRLLTAAGREHVVLDRGRVGERWRTERWDSLHLLTPAWMTRLPGATAATDDPDGYLSRDAFVGFLERYATSFAAPVLTGTTVREVAGVGHGPGRYRVRTGEDEWRADDVVVATGPHGTPYVPPGLAGITSHVAVVPAAAYRNPGELPAGGVLVVGASSSGVQIADELARAGRDVVLAVGRHTRMPRRYRGMDAFWWLESTGRLARTIDEVRDRSAARREPSLQLVGRPLRGRSEDLDLRTLAERGVRLAGRLEQVDGTRVVLRDDLGDTVADAEAHLHRFLDAADRHATQAGLDGELFEPDRPGAVPLPARPPTRLDLRADGIGTVLLATGYRPDLGWLRVPVTGPDGGIEQHRGATAAPGLYVVGQRFQHRRDSGFVDGARHDAAMVVDRLLADPWRSRSSRQGRAA